MSLINAPLSSSVCWSLLYKFYIYLNRNNFHCVLLLLAYYTCITSRSRRQHRSENASTWALFTRTDGRAARKDNACVPIYMMGGGTDVTLKLVGCWSCSVLITCIARVRLLVIAKPAMVCNHCLLRSPSSYMISDEPFPDRSRPMSC